jgi:hypothetical protein
MADISLPGVSTAPGRTRTTSYWLKVAQGLLLGFLIACGSWAAIRELTETDRCNTRLGRLSVALKLDQYYSRCQCMKLSLDFRDPCNSMYLPTLK